MNTKFCVDCGAEVNVKAEICPKCGVRQPLAFSSVSPVWYLVPIMFGLLGGILASALVYRQNPTTATNLLIVGLIQSGIMYLVPMFFLED